MNMQEKWKIYRTIHIFFFLLTYPFHKMNAFAKIFSICSMYLLSVQVPYHFKLFLQTFQTEFLHIRINQLLHFNATAVPPGGVAPHPALSSPGLITATKDSSLWLHWNYTYGGDSVGFYKYKEQIIGYKSKMELTLVPLAKRTGASGTLGKQASIVGPFSGRIDVIPDNSTLVVHNLRFNDSGTNFSSYIDIRFGPSQIQSIMNLRPSVMTIEVTGEFCVN